MKLIKWKILGLTCVVCLLPILLGVTLWERLPEVMAIHFDIYNNPDDFASKRFVVFALPCLMATLQVVCCIANDIKSQGKDNKFFSITKWIVPVATIILQTATLGYSLGWGMDIRKIASIIVGGIFLVTGSYLPKLDYIKNYNIDKDKALKINRFIGVETVVIGLLFVASIFMPPVATVVCVVLLIPYAILGIIYGITVCKICR